MTNFSSLRIRTEMISHDEKMNVEGKAKSYQRSATSLSSLSHTHMHTYTCTHGRLHFHSEPHNISQVHPLSKAEKYENLMGIL